MICAGVFLQCSLDTLYRGATGHFCRVFRYEKIVVCAGVFLLAVGEKADLSKSIAMSGNMCQ